MVVCIILLGGFAGPAFAQSEGDFFGELKQNLPDSGIESGQRIPASGEAETVITTSSLPVDVSSSYQAYDAGRDHVSGYVAGVAAVLGALVLAFVIGFVINHNHSSSEDQT